MSAKTRKLALTEGAIAGILFGTAAILIRLLPNIDAFSIVFWRLIIACTGLATILIVLKKKFSSKLVKENLKSLLILGTFIGLHFIFFASAVKDTTILNATVLVNTTPIFSMLVSSFIFKLKPSRIAILGLTISFIGACVITYAEVTTESAKNFAPTLKGDMEAIAAALVEAFYLNYGRKIRAQMDLLSTMLPVYFFAALLAGILIIPTTGKTLAIPTTMEIILPLIGLGLIPTAISHTLYFSSLSNLKSFETATMALLESIGATILGMAVFQEIPAPLFAFGASLVLAGIFFIIRYKS